MQPGNRAGNSNTDSRAAENVWPILRSTSASWPRRDLIFSGLACSLGLGVPNQGSPSSMAALPCSSGAPASVLTCWPQLLHTGRAFCSQESACGRRTPLGPPSKPTPQTGQDAPPQPPCNPETWPVHACCPFQLSPGRPPEQCFSESPGELVKSRIAGIHLN